MKSPVKPLKAADRYRQAMQSAALVVLLTWDIVVERIFDDLLNPVDGLKREDTTESGDKGNNWLIIGL